MQMKPQRRKISIVSRSFRLHARFTSDGPEPKDANAFREFYREAKSRAQAIQSRALKKREAELTALLDADEKTRSILGKVMRDEMSPDEAGRKVRRLVPDRKVAEALFEHWRSALEATTKAPTKEPMDIASEEADLLRRTRLSKADNALHKSLWHLADAAMAGDEDAARSLADAAVSASSLLGYAVSAHPEVFRRLARLRTQWAVLADEELGWEKVACRHVTDLGLGADLRIFKVRFRQARGADLNLPARLWAKAAVRVVEETRWRTFMLAQLNRDFGSPRLLADFCIDSGWQISDKAKWADQIASLPPLSRSSLTEWKPVVRQLIREEVPDFQQRAEWINQRRTAEANGRDTVGELRNAILDDIVSALASLAPVQTC